MYTRECVWNVSFTTNNRANEVMAWLKSESLKDDLDVQIYVIHPMLELALVSQDDNEIFFWSGIDGNGAVQMSTLSCEFVKLVENRWENDSGVNFDINIEMRVYPTEPVEPISTVNPPNIASVPQKCTCGGSRFGSHSSWCDLVSAS